MEFIKKMKKREFVEMTLKTISALLGCLIAIILMEGMIYSIKLNNALKRNNVTPSSEYTVAYCVKTGEKNNNGEDLYTVIYHSQMYTNDGDSKVYNDIWHHDSVIKYIKADCNTSNLAVKEVNFRNPNVFELVMNPIHYVVIAILVVGVAGFYTYRFIKLKKSYDKIEKEFNETGKIEF